MDANKDFNSWRLYAKADLDTANLLFNTSKNYHITVYHAHQAIEKALKSFLISKSLKFPFSHDLIALLKSSLQAEDLSSYLEDFSFIMDLYSSTRYPQGDMITREDAKKSISIANKICKKLNID